MRSLSGELQAACFTIPWITSRCLSGSISGAPERATTQSVRPFGVIMPVELMMGRAGLPCSDTVIGRDQMRNFRFEMRRPVEVGRNGRAPTVRLQGSLANGSAAALAIEPTPVAAAPASMTPDESSARRSNRPRFRRLVQFAADRWRRDLAMGHLPPDAGAYLSRLRRGSHSIRADITSAADAAAAGHRVIAF